MKVVLRVRYIPSRCYPCFVWICRCTFASYRRVLHRQWTIQRCALQYAAALCCPSRISYALGSLSIGKYFIVKHWINASLYISVFFKICTARSGILELQSASECIERFLKHKFNIITLWRWNYLDLEWTKWLPLV